MLGKPLVCNVDQFLLKSILWLTWLKVIWTCKVTILSHVASNDHAGKPQIAKFQTMFE